MSKRKYCYEFTEYRQYKCSECGRTMHKPTPHYCNGQYRKHGLKFISKNMKDKFTYIDLGLPSGRLWASENAEGYFTYDDAKEKFGELLPKPKAFEELWEKCQWLWDVKERRMVVVGPNNNTIFLPASSYRYNASGGLYDVGSYGYYWSCVSGSQAYAHNLGFNSSGVYPLDYSNRAYGFSVRLCKEQ